MVVSAHKRADAIGVKILENGGNAMDAAVAVAFALNVVHPAGAGMGGGGFAVLYQAGRNEVAALDFRDMAPGKVRPEHYMNEKGEVVPEKVKLGYRGAAVPGTVAGLDAIRRRYGTKDLAELMAPAIEAAETGVVIGRTYEALFREFAPKFRNFASTRKYFLKPDGSCYREGDLLVQKELARSLRIVAEKGPDALYRGEIADLIVRDMEAHGGLIGKEDLDRYRPIWREPVRGIYRGCNIAAMPPVSSGGITLIEMLNILEGFDLRKSGHNTAATFNLLAEAMRFAYADRSAHLGDPAFVDVPVKWLTSKEYAAEIRARIHPGRTTPSSEVKPGVPPIHEGTHTTFFSVVDSRGNAAALNFTIRDWFGCSAAVNGAGFFLNNTMDEFAIQTGVPNEYGLIYGEANLVAPYKRPLSSMTPTLLFRDGKVFLVTGSVGGPRIINAVLQVVSNIIDHGLNVGDAVRAPRVHMQWIPDELICEPEIPREVLAGLGEMGYAIKFRGPIPPDFLGEAHTILINPESGERQGAQDPRGDYTG